MSAEHHLAGPCAGMAIYREGRFVSIRDKSGRELETTHVLEDEEKARKFEWEARAGLYAKYENIQGGN
jgi:hypothetical protein